MTTLRDQLAKTLHDAACRCSAGYDPTNPAEYGDQADAVLALLADRLLPEGFSVTEKSPVYDVVGGKLMRREVIRADGPWIDWGGPLADPARAEEASQP